MRGSKYELKFDYQGKPVNEDEIRQVLRRGVSDTGQQQVLTGLSGGLGQVNNGASAANLPNNTADNEMHAGQSNSNISHSQSKDVLNQSASASLQKLKKNEQHSAKI